jgi:uncharacterized membrane protein YjgN (DUF898 family)
VSGPAGRQPFPEARLHSFANGGRLLLIILVNWILRILTLGIYHFWAKTRVREYLWSHTVLDGEPFSYTGRGLELLVGFVKALAVIAVLGFAAQVLASVLGPFGPWVSAIPQAVFFLVLFFLTAVGVYGARRYTLSRTRWRETRFAQTGSSFRYGGLVMGHGVLALLTLGLTMPFLRNRLLQYRVTNTWYGNARFNYDGRGRDLFPRFVLSYLLTLPTLGLVWLWYAAAEARYRAQHVSLRDVSFSMGYTGLKLLLLHLGNFLILILTLGVGYPWVVVRRIRFLFRHLRALGELDRSTIGPSHEPAPSTGEGLVELFDVGGGLLGLRVP